VIIRAVIGAAETASFDTVGETIRTNHSQSAAAHRLGYELTNDS